MNAVAKKKFENDPGQDLSATVYEAKTNLSALLAEVKKGKVVTITSGREKIPVARLTALPEAQPPRRFGALAHLNVKVPDAFFAPLTEEELKEWYGDPAEDPLA